MKGAFVYYGEHISKTHDLVTLLTSLVKNIPELAGFEDELDEISHYGVEVRYPDIFYEPLLEEAKEAHEIALKIRGIVLAKLKI